MESSVNAAKMLRCGSEVRPKAESQYFISALTISYLCAVTLLFGEGVHCNWSGRKEQTVIVLVITFIKRRKSLHIVQEERFIFPVRSCTKAMRNRLR